MEEVSALNQSIFDDLKDSLNPILKDFSSKNTNFFFSAKLVNNLFTYSSFSKKS